MSTKPMSTLRLPNSADVYEITDKKAREDKIDKDQGTENAGKLMAVGTDGKASLVNAPVSFDATYDENNKVLVLGGKSEIPGNVSVDPTLSETSTNAIQNQAVARKTNELSTNVTIVKNDLDVLKSRVDVMTSLEEGSTTGDAELQDIRVGTDGTVYDNAGEAVRSQINQLSEEIEGLTGNIYVGATQPTNGTEYWLDTSEDGDENTGGEEEPDTPVATYTITRTLTGCTSSSTATSITEGSYYKETITAEEGYTLSGADVTITMGGVDISSNYVDGELTIEEVTGNIVITIIATVDAWETLTLTQASIGNINLNVPIYSDEGTTEIGKAVREMFLSNIFDTDTLVSVTVTNNGVVCYVGHGLNYGDGVNPMYIYNATSVVVGTTKTVELVVPKGQQLIACGNYTQHWTVEAKKKV